MTDLLVCAATEMELTAFGEPSDGMALLVTGVGVPLALARTLEALGRGRPARILNIGIAGAYPGSGLIVGDLVVGTSEVYGDVGFELPEAPGFRHVGDSPWGAFYAGPLPLTVFPEFVGAREGRGCTVSACAGTEATGLLRARLFGAAFETMEGAAIAQAGQAFDVPVCEVRAISNLAARRDMRPENIRLALDALTEYLQNARKTTL